MTLSVRVHQRSMYFKFSKSHIQLYISLLFTRTLNFSPFSRYSISESSEYDTDCSCSPKVKYFIFTKAIYIFILVFCSDEHSISHRSQDILYLRVLYMTLSVRVHQRSNISSFLKAIYNFILVFCSHENSISHRSRDILYLRVLNMTLTVRVHQESNILRSPKAECNLILVFC